MLAADSDRLLVALEHSNGWWRDMAQNIIVSRKLVEVVPNLEKFLLAIPTNGPATRFVDIGGIVKA